MGRKNRFLTESALSMKLRALAVIRDSSLSAEDKRRIIERIQGDCVRSYGADSKQARELQAFISTMLRDAQMNEPKEEKTTGADPSGD